MSLDKERTQSINKVKKNKVSLKVKAPLFIGSIVIITAIAIGALTYIPINNNLVEKELSDLSREAHVLSAEFRANVENIGINAIFLSRVPPVDGMIDIYGTKDKDEQQWKKRLQTIFKLTMEGREDYLQVRLISAINPGHELVNLKRVNQQIEIIPDEHLQKKSEYDYYKETIKLKKGQIYISDINLNRENSKIEIPHTPVIRIATPVFTNENKLFGIIVINTQINDWFKKLNDQIDISKTLYIVNNRGDFIWHPSPTHRFSFETGEPYRLANEFGTTNLLFTNESNENQQVLINSKNKQIGLGAYRLKYDKRYPDKHIGFIVTMPYLKVIEKNQEVRNLTIVVGLSLSVIMILIAFYFIRKLLLNIGGDPEDIEKITSQIAKGDLDIHLEQNEESSTGIWASVQKMVIALKENREQTKNQNWLKSELSRVLTLSQRAQSIDELATSILSELAHILEVGFAAFYVCTDHSRGESTSDMGLFASFGMDGSNSTKTRIRPGVGLAGQCLLEGKKIVLTDVPANYSPISSSLGQHTPLTITCLPIILENQTLAVIEFGSFHQFDQIQIELLDLISTNLGVAISNITGKFRTQALLEESQQMSEELQAQSEELQAINEELEEKSEKLTLQKEELITANDELEEKSNALQLQKIKAENITLEIELAKKELEEKAKDLAETSRFKSDFLANMSHELRTPLNSLLILSKSLAKNKTGNLTTDQVESAQIIYKGGLDLLNLINDILDLSKVEAGKMDITLDYINLRSCLENLLKHFQPAANDKSLDLQVFIDENVSPTIISDQHRIEQILRNLLSNAIKFTSKGSITISANIIEENKCIAISVQDTGIGIPESKFQAIFEAFQQADGSTSRNFGGTGLGLTISNKLANLLDGEIRVESSLGKGSLFTLILPNRDSLYSQKSLTENNSNTFTPNSNFSQETAQGLPTNSENPKPKLTKLNKKNILIIEDDQTLISYMKSKFEKIGYTCKVTKNNREGFKLALDTLPEALIINIDLPGINGVELIQHLKENLDTRHIIIYATTSNPEIQPEINLGSIKIIQKPAKNTHLDKMFEYIENALSWNTKKILLIDTNKKTNKTVNDLLSNMDISLIQANNASEALSFIKKENFDCIILEIKLADMDAIDIFEEIKKIKEDEFPPAIIYTDQEVTREQHNLLQKYTDTIIVKGFHSASRLLDEISQRLHSSKESLPYEQRKVIEHLHESDKILKNKRVLVVDDDVKNSFAMSKILSEKEVIVEVADSGALAIEKLKVEEFDLILMDIMMPVMDGIEAIQHIRANNLTAHIPIIALTAKAMPEDKKQCIAAGANDYLTKPIDVDKLFSIIKVWLFNKKKQ